MAWPTKKPPSGMPASGIPAGGPGWGGPPKGAPARPDNGRDARAPTITPETAPAIQALRGTPEAVEKRKRRIATFEEVMQTWTEILEDGTAPHMARTHAGQAIADRLKGKAVQKTEITGEDGGPIETIRRVVVDPRNSDS